MTDSTTRLDLCSKIQRARIASARRDLAVRLSNHGCDVQELTARDVMKSGDQKLILEFLRWQNRQLGLDYDN